MKVLRSVCLFSAASLALAGCATSNDRLDTIEASLARIETRVSELQAGESHAAGDAELDRTIVQLQLQRAEMVRIGVFEANETMKTVDGKLAAALALQSDRRKSR